MVILMMMLIIMMIEIIMIKMMLTKMIMTIKHEIFEIMNNFKICLVISTVIYLSIN